MPRSTSQLSKGASMPPVVLPMRRMASPSSRVAVTTKPLMVSLWPARYLVPLCTTRSAPSERGCWNTGDRNVLSTMSSAPAPWASSAQARMSVTFIMGLLGVSM